MISVPPQVKLTPDEEVWIEFDQSRLHMFDGETQMALKAG
jgi:multiple sugar transport system ATP-binding protein